MLRKLSRLDIMNVSPIKFQADISVYYNKYTDKFFFKLSKFEDAPKDKVCRHLFDIEYKKLRFLTKTDFMNMINKRIDLYNHNG